MIVPGIERDPGSSRANPDHEQQIERQQVPEAELERPRQHLADGGSARKFGGETNGNRSVGCQRAAPLGEHHERGGADSDWQ